MGRGVYQVFKFKINWVYSFGQWIAEVSIIVNKTTFDIGARISSSPRAKRWVDGTNSSPGPDNNTI